MLRSLPRDRTMTRPNVRVRPIGATCSSTPTASRQHPASSPYLDRKSIAARRPVVDHRQPRARDQLDQPEQIDPLPQGARLRQLASLLLVPPASPRHRALWSCLHHRRVQLPLRLPPMRALRLATFHGVPHPRVPARSRHESRLSRLHARPSESGCQRVAAVDAPPQRGGSCAHHLVRLTAAPERRPSRAFLPEPRSLPAAQETSATREQQSAISSHILQMPRRPPSNQADAIETLLPVYMPSPLRKGSRTKPHARALQSKRPTVAQPDASSAQYTLFLGGDPSRPLLSVRRDSAKPKPFGYDAAATIAPHRGPRRESPAKEFETALSRFRFGSASRQEYLAANHRASKADRSSISASAPAKTSVELAQAQRA